MEIVTLQFGTLSNHIMTHYWNIQDEQLKLPDETVLNYDKLFYETKKGRYPYVLFFDREISFGNFYGAFDKQKEDIKKVEEEMAEVWQGGYIITEDDYIEKSEFSKALDDIDDQEDQYQQQLERQQEKERKQQELLESAQESHGYKNMFEQFLKASMQDQEENIETETKPKEEEEKEEETPADLYHKFKFNDANIRFFTDFMQCQMSEKSMVSLPQYSGSWGLFSEGKQLLNDQYLLDEMTDHFRDMLERADNIQGIRVLVDTD